MANNSSLRVMFHATGVVPFRFTQQRSTGENSHVLLSEFFDAADEVPPQGGSSLFLFLLPEISSVLIQRT